MVQQVVHPGRSYPLEERRADRNGGAGAALADRGGHRHGASSGGGLGIPLDSMASGRGSRAA